VIKEMGSYAVPDVTVGENGEVYVFAELEREKAALEKYRSTINPEASNLGKTVFDSGGD
jgi:exosome complex RNA-binding protein Rrp4